MRVLPTIQITLCLFLIFADACIEKEVTPATHGTEQPVILPLSGSVTLKCGVNSGKLDWRITRPVDLNSQKFAFALGGSPGTNYFSEDLGRPQYKILAQELVSRGYHIFEHKYAPNGFYDLCRRQGFDNIKKHESEVYKVAIKNLGFDPKDVTQKLVGVGFSLGAIQLQSMAFMNGQRIDRIALTGVLLGDPVQGCESAKAGQSDGFTWIYFSELADVLTPSGAGCTGNVLEYGEDLKFENLPSFAQWNVGLFEGARITGWFPGNIRQAEYIKIQREKVLAPVQLFSYNDCGHEILTCDSQAVPDIINYLVSDN